MSIPRTPVVLSALENSLDLLSLERAQVNIRNLYGGSIEMEETTIGGAEMSLTSSLPHHRLQIGLQISASRATFLELSAALAG